MYLSFIPRPFCHLVLLYNSPSLFLVPLLSTEVFKESSENKIGPSSFFLVKTVVLPWHAILVILLKSMSAFRILSYPSSFFRNVKTLNGSDFAGRILDVYLIFVDFHIKPFYD